MKKSTVLIVLITFVLSVVLVGIFGMQMMSYDTKIYIDKIVPREVITSANIPGVRISESKEVAREYSVTLPYLEGLVVRIDFELTPADATQRTVELSVTSSNAENFARIEGMNIAVLREGTIRLRYRATDGSETEITVYLYVIPADDYYARY